MRVNNAPEHDCPDCEDRPPLVYYNSVGPAGAVAPGQSMAGEPNLHFYKCAECGGTFMSSTSGQPLLTPPNQARQRPQKECITCGPDTMRVRLIADGGVPDSKRNPDGTFNRVASKRAWKCESCGDVVPFSEEDLWL